MTTDLQVSAPPVEAERTAGGGPLSVLRLPAWPARVWAEHFSLLLALVVWALPVTRATGGREGGVLAVGLAACVPGLLLVLPRAVADRRVRGRTVGLALLLPAAALVVCLTAPTGWMGGSDIAACAYAPLLALLVFAYCSSPGRRLTVATMIGLAGLAQFAEAWVPWWGGGVSGRAMIGTFYWHNQFAAFLLPPAVIGLALALWRVPPVRAGYAPTADAHPRRSVVTGFFVSVYRSGRRILVKWLTRPSIRLVSGDGEERHGGADRQYALPKRPLMSEQVPDRGSPQGVVGEG